MKRNEFLIRLAVENKIAFVSDTVEVFRNTLDRYPISHTTLPSTSPQLKSPKENSSQQSNNETTVGGSVSCIIEEPIMKPLYENCSKTNTHCAQKKDITLTTSTELALPQGNGNYSYASSPTTEQYLHFTSAENEGISESYYPVLNIPEMSPSESLIDKLSTSHNNECVDIISDIILKPAISRETDCAHLMNNLTSNMAIKYDKSNFYDKDCDYVVIETGSVDSINRKNITMLTSTSDQKFKESSPNFATSKENTDSFDLWPVYNDTSLLELDNTLLSDSDDEYESSGDNYVPSTDNDSGSEISIEDVHRTYSNNTQEDITLMNMEDKLQTDSKNTMQNNHKCFHLDTNKLDIKLSNQIESTEDTNVYIFPETSSITNQQYIRKESARERPTICPLCYEDVITHFPRHLSRHHSEDPEVKRMLNLKPNSKERLDMLSAFRKRGYFILKTEKNISRPVRSSKAADTDHFVCTFCLGLYNKKTLYRHVKICKSKPCDVTNPGKNCLSKSQTFMSSKNHEFLRTSRLKKEVFETMRADAVSSIAKSDPLICLYGDVILAKHRRQQIATLVSNKMREMAKMLIAIRSMHDNIRGLFDVLKPEMFSTLVTSAKIISGYNENDKNFKAPSLALHMGTNLKIVCNIAIKIVIERKHIPNISWENRNDTKSDIKDLKDLIEAHWCNEISSLALKDLKERQWKKPNRLPLSEDILLFKKYIEDVSKNAHESLRNGINVKDSYKKLTECVLAQTIMFNRKRVGDVQYLKIETYERDNTSTTHEEFSESLTELEKILCRQFKRVITDGKGSKPVPILFSTRSQEYISSLLKIRKTTNIVPKSNSFLFANPDVQNKWIRGDYVIRMLARKCGAKHPVLLTSTKFRKHIATTLQLMNMGADEMEQLATFMGHTKKTHAQFYRLPQDIYQTAKVVKVLLLLEKGKGNEFRGKNIEEINLDKHYYKSDTSDEEDKYEITTKNIEMQFSGDEDNTTERGGITGDMETCSMVENSDKLMEDIAGDNREDLRKKRAKNQKTEGNKEEEKENYDATDCSKEKTTEIQRSSLKPIAGRSRWTSAEKKLAGNYFQEYIKNRVTPKKHECNQFLSKYGDKMMNKNWIQIKTFVYNTFRQK